MSKYRVRPGQKVNLGKVDPSDVHLVDTKAEAEHKSAAMLLRLDELQLLLFARHERQVLIVLQGLDTSGKDGVIRHVMAAFNPQGLCVVSFRQPSLEELDHRLSRFPRRFEIAGP